MNLVAVVVIGAEEEMFASVRDAAERAFPNCEVVSVPPHEFTCDSVCFSKADLVVLAGSASMELQNILVPPPDSGLPRWPVLTVDSCDSNNGMECVHPDELVGSSGARILRSALLQHRLRRENERARGDLWTISRRINHDFRTQLGCIVTAGEALLEIVAAEAPSGLPIAHRIIDSVDSLVKLIERVSFVARATANPPVKESLDMGIAFWFAMQKLEHRLLKNGALVTQPTVWPTIQGVESWLEVVWFNLMSNALQHGGSPLAIDVGWTKEECVDRFWVRDNGPGVPAEARQMLFEPFHSLHEPDSGIGLGLSIVQRLVELQGGECGFTPVEQGGSTFYFILPRAVDPE